MSSAVALSPRVHTIVICNGVRKSKTESGVFHLKGVRQSIISAAFPFVPENLWLFLVLTSPRPGRFPGSIRVVREQTGKAVFFAHLDPSPSFGTGFEAFFVRTPIRCRFTEPGHYLVQVWFFREHEQDVQKGELPFLVESELES